MYILPNPNAPSYRVSTTIEGGEYTLEYTYDEHRNLWRLGVILDDDVVLGHQPLYVLNPLYVIPFASELTGAFVCVPVTGEAYSYEALLELDYAVVYAEGEELDVLLALSDDVFESVSDTFITPIVVTYPQQGAVLSNATVTLTGTGPANQTITARGEDIPVDFAGNWSWTHTFMQSANTVTFEGSDGQRTSVSFSIVMQPLMIDDPSDAAGYVYLTEQPITGQGTPNSVIEVNGQSVQVAQDGSWSTVVHLNAGVNMVVASSQDGQSAMLVLDLFDPVTLSPEIWLDPTDQSTLFRDAEGTQPVEAAGDPVGLIVNKGTLGGDADLIAPDSASRPVWLGDVLRWDGSQRMGTSGWAPDWGFTWAAYSISAEIGESGWFVGVGANSPRAWNCSGNRSGWLVIGNNVAISDGSEYDGVENNLTPELLAYPKTTNASGGWTDGVRAWHMTATEYKDSSNMPAHGWTGRGPANKPSQGIRFGAVRWTSLWYAGVSGPFFLFDRELTQQEMTQLLRWMEAQHD